MSRRFCKFVKNKTTAPNLPETGKEIDASYMFDECDNIVYAPAKIPEGVYTMSMMFSACYKLNNYNAFIDKYVYEYDEKVQKENIFVLWEQ